MADDSAVKLNDVVAGDIKRTRSGRVSLPPLAFWAGERLFTPLNADSSGLYIPPKQVEKNNSYITPSTGLQGKLLNSLSSVELSKSADEVLQTKWKQSRRQPNRTAAAKKETVVDKRIASDQNDLSSLPELNHRNSDANHSEHPKRNATPSQNQNHSLPGDLLASNARDSGPKQSSLCSSSTPTTSSSENYDGDNVLDRVPSSKKKTVTWSDSKSALSSASRKDIFMTAISNSRKLRSEKMPTPLKSALTRKPNSTESNCLPFNLLDNKQKLRNHEHNTDHNSLEIEPGTTKSRSITEDKAQKHERVKRKPVVESDDPMFNFLDDNEQKSSSDEEDSDQNYTPAMRTKTVAQTKAQKHKKIKGKTAVVNDCPITALLGYESKHKSSRGDKESSDENDLPGTRNKAAAQTRAQKHRKLKGKPTVVNDCPITGLFDNEGKHESSSDEKSSDHNDLPITRNKTVSQTKAQKHSKVKGKSTVKDDCPITGLFSNEGKHKSSSDDEESSDHNDPPVTRNKTVTQTKVQRHRKAKGKSTVKGGCPITGLFGKESEHKSSSGDEESSDHNDPPITRNKTVTQTKVQRHRKAKGKSTVKDDCPITGLFSNEGEHISNSDDEESSDHNEPPITRNKTVAQTKTQKHTTVKSKSSIKGDCPITGLFSNEDKHISSNDDDEESSDHNEPPITRNKTIAQTKMQKHRKTKGKSNIKSDCPITGLFSNEGKHKSNSDDEESSDYNEPPITRNKTVAQTKAQKHTTVKSKSAIKGDCPITGLFSNEGKHKSNSDDEDSNDHNELPITRNKTIAQTKMQKHRKAKGKSNVKSDCPMTCLSDNESEHKSSSGDEESSEPITRNKTVAQTKMQKHRKTTGKSTVKGGCPISSLFDDNQQKSSSDGKGSYSNHPLTTRNKTLAQTKALKHKRIKCKPTSASDCPINDLFGNESEHNSSSDDDDSSSDGDYLPTTRNKTVAQIKASKPKTVKSRCTVESDSPINDAFGNDDAQKSSSDDEGNSDQNVCRTTRDNLAHIKPQKNRKVKSKSIPADDCLTSALTGEDHENGDPSGRKITKNKKLSQSQVQKRLEVKNKSDVNSDFPLINDAADDEQVLSSDGDSSEHQKGCKTTRNNKVTQARANKGRKVKNKANVENNYLPTTVLENGKSSSIDEDDDSSDEHSQNGPRKGKKVANAQKHQRNKNKPTNATSKLKTARTKSKVILNDDASVFKTNRVNQRHGIDLVSPCKSHHSELKKHEKVISHKSPLSSSSVSENEGDHYTPRRLRQPKRKRLTHAIIEDDSDSNSAGQAVVSHLGKKIRKSPEKDILLLDLLAVESENQQLTAKNISQSSTLTKRNVKSTSSSERNTKPSTTSKRNKKRATRLAAKNVQTSASEKKSELATAPVIRCSRSSELRGPSISPEEPCTGPAEENSPDANPASPECHQLSDPESASDPEFHEDVEELSEDDHPEESEDRQELEKSSSSSEKDEDIDDNDHENESDHENENNLARKNVTACCIADLFADSPKPNSRRKTVSAYLKRAPNPTTTRRGASKKHSQSWNNLKRTLHTHLDQMKKTAKNKNKEASKAKGSKATSLRREIIDKKVPKAGTLKMKKWLKQQQDELNRGHKEDDFFKEANLPNMKPLMKNLNMTEEASELNLDFTTPRSKFHSDLSKRKSPSPPLDDSIFGLVANKKLADICVHRRKKRLKRKDDDDEKVENKKKKGQSEETIEEQSPESTTPPALTQEVIKQAMQDVNDMLSRAAVEDQEEDAMSTISSDELEDYYFDDP